MRARVTASDDQHQWVEFTGTVQEILALADRWVPGGVLRCMDEFTSPPDAEMGLVLVLSGQEETRGDAIAEVMRATYEAMQ